MRHRGLVFGVLFGLSAIPSGGCSRTPSTEYVTGFSTQVQVPREFQTLEVSIWARNDAAKPATLVACHQVAVVNGIARLPKTLGIYQQSDSPNMMVSVIAFNDPVDKVLVERVDCNLEPPTSLSARVLRRSQQNYRNGRTLYLPMPLKYACFENDCRCAPATPAAPGKPATPAQVSTSDNPCQEPGGLQASVTCVAGTCQNASRNELVFRDYSPDLAFGDSSACFSIARCMADAVEPTLEDAATCTYSVPGSADGMNVRAIFDGFVTEMLDIDGVLPPGFQDLTPEEQKAVKDDIGLHEEGFTILPNGKFRLAKGLCELTRADITKTKPKAKRILSIAASRSCPPKQDAQPLCDEGAEVLIPAASRLYILLDRSKDMQPLLKKDAIEQALSISLDDPVFSTTDVAFRWMPSINADACEVPTPDTYAKSETGLRKVLDARGQLVDSLTKQDPTKAADRMSLANVLTLTGGAYDVLRGDTAKVNQRALLIITNAAVGKLCTGAPAPDLAAAVAKATGERIRTYLIELGQSGLDPDGVTQRTDEGSLPRQDRAAQGLALVGKDFFFDATRGSDFADPNNAAAKVSAQALAAIIKDLSTCLYEKPASITDTSTLKVAYTGGTQDVPFNAQCTVDNADTPDGWNVDPTGTLIRVCGNSCRTIRDLLGKVGGNSTARRSSAVTKSPLNPLVQSLPPTIFVTATSKKTP